MFLSNKSAGVCHYDYAILQWNSEIVEESDFNDTAYNFTYVSDVHLCLQSQKS